MGPFNRRLSALFVAMALLASPVALCAGWTATAKSRMACCAASAGCPMHGQGAASPMAVSQADADRCCGAAEQDDASSSPTSPAPAASSAPIAAIAGPVPMVLPSEAVTTDAWRRRVPLPVSPPAHHFLLSVLLV